jgi:hypothetical protein
MKSDKFESLVVQMAREILDMYDAIEYLNLEVKELREYKKKYFELLNESIKHGEDMSVNMLKLFLTPGVVECCSKANNQDPSKV